MDGAAAEGAAVENDESSQMSDLHVTVVETATGYITSFYHFLCSLFVNKMS